VKIPSPTFDRFFPSWGALFAIAFAVNLIVHRPLPPGVVHTEIVNVAHALERGESFSNPFQTGPSGPTAHVAPLYPFLYAAICSMFGTGIAGALAIHTLTTLVWALHCAFVHRFAKLHGHGGAGIIAAVLLAAAPLPDVLFRWEAVFTAATIAAGACLLSLILAGRSGAALSAGLGLLMASGTLLNPATILIWTAWAALLIAKASIQSWRVLMPAALLFLIPVSAWMARDYAVFQHFIFILDNIGMELAGSYNDCAIASMSLKRPSECYTPFHPNNDRKVELVLIAMGEYRFNARCGAYAVAWIQAHPLQSAAITAGHMLFFWYPIERAGLEALIDGIGISILTVLSLLGVAWHRSTGFQIAGAALLSYSSIYYFFQPVPRYRYPVLWITVLLATIGIEQWIARRNPKLR
jgi:hypothetical protein